MSEEDLNTYEVTHNKIEITLDPKRGEISLDFGEFGVTMTLEAMSALVNGITTLIVTSLKDEGFGGKLEVSNDD